MKIVSRTPQDGYLKPGYEDVFILGDGTSVLNVHPESTCKAPCSIHAPSNHPARHLPTAWGGQSRRICRRCPCGEMHPDPDNYDVKWHYCDCHCCNGWYTP